MVNLNFISKSKQYQQAAGTQMNLFYIRIN